MADKQKVYTVSIKGDEIVAKLESESERRQLSRAVIVRDVVEQGLQGGSRMKYLQDKCDRLERQLEACREMRDKAERENVEFDNLAREQIGIIDRLRKQCREVEHHLEASRERRDRLAEQNNDLDKARNQAIKERNKFKEKFEKAITSFEKLALLVEKAKQGNVFKRASAVKAINTGKFVVEAVTDAAKPLATNDE